LASQKPSDPVGAGEGSFHASLSEIVLAETKIGRGSAMKTTSTDPRPPLPPFTFETAVQKVRLIEGAWNSRAPEKMVLAYAANSRWRNRAEFPNGRHQIAAFLKRKWPKELDYRLIKELRAFSDNRIAVRFAYEWRDDSGNWLRSYDNENWELNPKKPK
jgi:nuclear transport factor 2 (NTF2) superfamily protein